MINTHLNFDDTHLHGKGSVITKLRHLWNRNRLWICFGAHIIHSSLLLSCNIRSIKIIKERFPVPGCTFSLARIISCRSVTKRCLTLWDLLDTPGSLVLHCLPGFAQIHVCWVSNAIHPTHPLPRPSPPPLSLSQHQGIFQWVNSMH